MEAEPGRRPELGSGWGTEMKRQPTEPTGQPMAELVNQCATAERLLDALAWAGSRLGPTAEVLLVHPSTSSSWGGSQMSRAWVSPITMPFCGVTNSCMFSRLVMSHRRATTTGRQRRISGPSGRSWTLSGWATSRETSSAATCSGLTATARVAAVEVVGARGSVPEGAGAAARGPPGAAVTSARDEVRHRPFVASFH